jgi:hypothetical protein
MVIILVNNPRHEKEKPFSQIKNIKYRAWEKEWRLLPFPEEKYFIFLKMSGETIVLG